jgi:hypothetical protein
VMGSQEAKIRSSASLFSMVSGEPQHSSSASDHSVIYRYQYRDTGSEGFLLGRVLGSADGHRVARITIFVSCTRENTAVRMKLDELQTISSAIVESFRLK